MAILWGRSGSVLPLRCVAPVRIFAPRSHQRCESEKLHWPGNHRDGQGEEEGTSHSREASGMGMLSPTSRGTIVAPSAETSSWRQRVAR